VRALDGDECDLVREIVRMPAGDGGRGGDVQVVFQPELARQGARGQMEEMMPDRDVRKVRVRGRVNDVEELGLHLNPRGARRG
jgi:hypothetical protein